MEYKKETSGRMREESRGIEGPAYIVASVGMNTGLDIIEVPEGESWREGVGEELKFVADSYEEAKRFMRKTYGYK